MLFNIDKKIFILAAILLSLTFLSNSVRADSVVTITLQGIVDTVCFSTFQTDPAGQNLDLTLDATSTAVAEGTLFCNDPDGFTVSLTTKNGAAATATTGNGSPTPGTPRTSAIGGTAVRRSSSTSRWNTRSTSPCPWRFTARCVAGAMTTGADRSPSSGRALT